MAERTAKVAVYNFGGELKSAMARIDRSTRMDAATKSKIHEFIDHIAVQGAGKGRQTTHAYHLIEICERLGGPVSELNRHDIERLMASLPSDS